MSQTKRFGRWWFMYSVIELDLDDAILRALFPRRWGLYGREEWEHWALYFITKVCEGFSDWMRSHHGSATWPTGIKFQSGDVFIQQLDLAMEADANVTFVQGPVDELDMPTMWCLYWKREHMWVQYPSGKKLMIPLWGSHLRIQTMVKQIVMTGNLAAESDKDDDTF